MVVISVVEEGKLDNAGDGWMRTLDLGSIVIDRFIILMMAGSFTGGNICQSISNYTLKHMQFNIYQ